MDWLGFTGLAGSVLVNAALAVKISRMSRATAGAIEAKTAAEADKAEVETQHAAAVAEAESVSTVADQWREYATARDKVHRADMAEVKAAWAAARKEVHDLRASDYQCQLKLAVLRQYVSALVEQLRHVRAAMTKAGIGGEWDVPDLPALLADPPPLKGTP